MENPIINTEIEVVTAELVKCGTCKESKPRSSFSKCRSRKNGLQTSCKACKSKMAKKLREKYKKQKNTKILVNEQKCTRCNTVKPSSEFYKDTTKKNGIQSFCKTCDTKASKHFSLNRFGRLRDNNHTELTAEQIAETLEVYKEAERLKQLYPDTVFNVDHIVPISLGGTHTADNIQILTLEEHIEKTKAEAVLIKKVKEAYAEYEMCFSSKSLKVITSTANQ